MAIRGLMKLDEMTPEGLPLWQLTEPYNYLLPFYTRTIDGAVFLAGRCYTGCKHWQRWDVCVPKGFTTDFASIPRWFHACFNPTDPRWDEAALIHDYLYRNTTVPRFLCDAIFLEIMHAEHTPWLARNLIYYSVRIFGGRVRRQWLTKHPWPRDLLNGRGRVI